MSPRSLRSDTTQDLRHSRSRNGAKSDADIVPSTCQLAWKGITYTVNGGKKNIISDIDGCVQQGSTLAIMGPSGCGKTTLLNCLAQRLVGKFTGTVTMAGVKVTPAMAKTLTAYVPQEDSLIGALTVRETIDFSACLLLDLPAAERRQRVDAIIEAFGLSEQAHTLIGTPLRRGVSGGQKRRVSCAAQLITVSKVIWLDEPTSGLDSVAAYEVISVAKRFATTHQLVIVASIHQPSTATYRLFDKLLLLSNGHTVYHGSVYLENFFEGAGAPVPRHYNPADFLLEVTNTDFSSGSSGLDSFGKTSDGPALNPTSDRLQHLLAHWRSSPEATELASSAGALTEDPEALAVQPPFRPSVARQTYYLLRRSLIKASRDVVVYGVRFAMYLGLAILMGTVWLRLGTGQEYIQLYLNAMFFASAFLSFMAVAYIPAFLEDRSALVHERANGLYGVTGFMLANVLVGVPFLFLITLSFCLVTYWLMHLNPSATAFFRYLCFLFLDLIAAESLVVLVAALVPIFVAALALTAFANGLWMSVGGFLVVPSILNPFYKFFFRQIDYQRYVFEALIDNELGNRVYSCGKACACAYQGPLAAQCKIAGQSVLSSLGYGNINLGKWAGLLVVISFVMRLMAWGVLQLTTR